MTYADVNDAYDNGRHHIATFRKVRSTSATFITDMSYGAGTPIANYYASTPLVMATLPSNEGIYHLGGVNKYLHKVMVHSPSTSVFPAIMMLNDYIAYVPFIDCDSTDEQVLNTPTLPRYIDGKGVQVMIVCQGAGTASGNITINYTNQDGVSNRTSTTFIDMTSGAGYLATSRSKYILLMQGDRGIRSIESVTLPSALGGIVTLVFVHPIVEFTAYEVGAPIELDMAIQRNMLPSIDKDAYLNFCIKSQTGAGVTIQATLDLIW
jgi:hypothetical protein